MKAEPLLFELKTRLVEVLVSFLKALVLVGGFSRFVAAWLMR
ncbi:hypothetical protein [Prochlorococcus sp. MIT 1303]|nr:hypothetical protein [Prochlorococcus sp. MIT 1303]